MKVITSVISILAICTCLGCARQRDTTSPTTALVGHWETEDTTVQYYFSAREMIMYEMGTYQTLTYEVRNSDPANRTLDIFVRTKEGPGHKKVFTFSDNWKTAVVSSVFTSILGGDRATADTWRYVDGKTEP